MPTEIEPDAIATHAPLIAALAEQLEMEAESALSAPAGTQQLVHVAALQAITRILTRETARLMTAVRDAAPRDPAAADE